MRTIPLLMIFIIACGSSNSTRVSKATEAIDPRFYNGFSKNDTIVFTNPKFGNDTLIIDSLQQYEITNLDVNNHKGMHVYGKYICGSKVRLDQHDIWNELKLLDEFGGEYIYYSQKFKNQPQSHIFRLGEFFSMSGNIDSTSTELSIPNYGYDIIITSDTLYTEPSDFHINKLLWSNEYGLVGFVTLGNHLWYRQK